MPTETIEGFPLSLQQKRLWSFRENGGEQELTTEAEYAISGALDAVKFEAALRRVVERHEVCRSVYKNVPGLPEPVQILEENFELRPSGTGQRLETAPVFDWELKEAGENEYRLSVRFPAVAADYSSLWLLMEDLGAQYGHVVAGTQDESEPMQYLDYAQWQAELQESPEARASHQYWRNLNSDQTGYILPLERAEQGFASGCEVRNLPRETVQALELIDRTFNLPAEGPEIVVCAAWVSFCARLTEANSEMVLGVNTSGRSFEELQKAVGPYDRLLPVEVNLQGEATVSAAVQGMNCGLRKAQQHQEFYAGELLSASSAQEGGMAFQMAYRRSANEVRGGGLTFEMVNGKSHTEPFKLKLEFVEGPRSALRIYYNARCITGAYAAVLADRFKEFLNEFVARPDARVADLKFASDREIGMVTGDFARSGIAEAKKATLIEMINAEVGQHPQRPAIICDGQIFSYGELNASANQLANRLLASGVKVGEAVAISAERSREMIVGLLGIQKAGGAYVPLDPGYPKDRLEQVIQDCGAKVLVAQPHLAGKLPEHQCQVVELDLKGLASDKASEPEVRLDADKPAYVIYTSGSTGKPKGVAITHRKLAVSTAARFEYYKEPIANYLLLSSFAFDSSIAGIFWSLAQGGTLTIPREGMHQDPRELLRLIREYKVSHLLALPSFYQAILEQAVATEVSSLTTVIVAGEACSPELVLRHYAKLPKATLYNEYGPTEGTVWSTVHRCEANVPGPVPIGRPVPNMSAYILNDRREPVGVGELGELYIGGPAVVEGYLNRPELTNEKFVASSLLMGGGKLYRTGDLARFREDGLIEFHGRIDEQVKIRGYRIEIGEIEHVLGRHPEVREAVVVAREEAPGDKRLVAYVVPKEQGHLSIPEIRLFAQEKLPQFMVPAQIVSLKTLPLTPNGKIDRKALPAPDDVERSERDYIAPRNRDEEQLAKIWTEVLKLDKVSVEENFFDLGGHSLLAIQVIARVRDAFKLELPMSEFFEAPTIGGMAAALGRCREAKGTGTGGIKRVARVAATDEILAKLNSNP
jgi:amino acid adenylation domain-containing protein